MAKQQDWEKIFPEFDPTEPPKPEPLPQDTFTVTTSSDLSDLGQLLDYDWNSSWSSSSWPSLTAADLVSIDFANIGNISLTGFSNLTTVTLPSTSYSNVAGLNNGVIFPSSSYAYSGSTWQNTVEITGGNIKIQEGGDLFIGNVGLGDRLNQIEDRLGILRPNPEIEREFDELKRLGDEYRKLEQELKDRLKTFETLKRE